MTDNPFFLDWRAFWLRDHQQAEWVLEDVLARGRAHAIYAAHKAGKSLLLLWAILQLVRAGIVVVYLDFEMTEDDLHERLEDMGHGPDSDLSKLRYALLPSLPPLDTREGAKRLLAIVDDVQKEFPADHIVVVIDTTSRAVAGEENSADTIRDFYRYTGLGLKQRGVTWVRLDHAGKDTSLGQRGTSAKGDDVDIVWRLARTDNGITLTRDAARMGWVPEKVTFHQADDPLRFVRVEEDWPAGTRETADLLDGLDVAVTASTREAALALREANSGRRRDVVVAAQKYRRELFKESAE